MLSINKINEYFYLSIPILLITGSFFPDLLIVIIFFYSIYLLINKKILIENNLKFFILFFILFYSISLIASYNSLDKILSLKSSFFYFRYIGLIFFGYYIYKTNHRFLEQLGKIVFFIFIFFFIDSITFFLFEFSISTDNLANNRFSSFFGSEQVLGSYVARLSPLSFIYILNLKNKNLKKNLFIINIILALYLIILSGERTALFLFFVQIFIIFVLIKEARKVLFFLSGTTIILTLSILIFFSDIKISKPIERIIFHTIKQLYFDNKQLTMFSSRHQDHFYTALNIFKSNIMLGSGNKAFRVICKLPEYSVKDKIENRNSVYAQYDGNIDIIPHDDKRFRIFYKTSNKFHSYEQFKPKNFREFIKVKRYYELKDKYFLYSDLSNQELDQIKKNFFNKNQKLFIEKSRIEFKDGCNSHPHNYYLQVASENGIVNLVLLFGLFLYVSYSIIKTYFLDKSNVVRIKATFILIMIFIQLIPFIPSGNFYNNWLSIFLFMPIGFYLAIKDYHKQ